jgi:hypothetical protein
MGTDKKGFDCITVGDVKKKWANFHDRGDKEKERENDRDEDRERDEDERDEDEDSDEEEEARGDDEVTIIYDDNVAADDYPHDAEEGKWEELRAVVAELGEACGNGDEAACTELRELITELEKDREQVWEREQKDSDDSRCVGKHMMNHMKKMFSRDRDEEERNKEWDSDDRDDAEWEELEELRAVMAELGVACEEGDEEACEELEELITEIVNDERERKEECDEHDGDNDDESEEEEDEEEDLDDDDEDDSEDDDPENA